MAAAVMTRTNPAETSRGLNLPGMPKVRYLDITADTGDYAAGGFTFTARQLGLATVWFCAVGSLATQATAGAEAVGVGVTYVSNGTSVKFQLYEVDTAADGAPFQEKQAEAFASNFTFRVRVEGI